MTTSSIAKKDIQKLQRAIVDGLEDVKAQDIQVFDTEQLSALFERVIVASGTSNRQTKALAASVRDSVREAGFDKPRMEGEANGEWIIVDCVQAVVHIMQPTFRQYYHLEELWGEKPVRLKLGATKPVKTSTTPTAPTKSTASKSEPSLRRSSAVKKAQRESAPAKKVVAKTAASKSSSAKSATKKSAATKFAATKSAATKSVTAKTAVSKKPALKATAVAVKKTPRAKTK
jgi:ribosome-associated protein